MSMRVLNFKMSSETVDKITTDDNKVLEVTKAFRMNIVTGSEIIGSVEASESGHVYVNLSTGLPPEIIKKVVLELLKGGTIELPEIPQEHVI